MKNNQFQKLSFPEVRIVEASAGSGKTYALARRYIQLLINPYLDLDEIALKNILAITFTNKAAREMKERILDFLKKISLDAYDCPEEKKDMLEYLGVNEKEATAKARGILEKLIQNFNYFQVQTIDSFINIILSGCALDLKLSANFRIKETHLEYLKYSFDECIDKVKEDRKTAKIFDNFLKQYLYIENRNSWFAKNDVIDIIAALFSNVFVYGGGFTKFDISTAEILKQKKKTFALIAALLKKCPPEGLHKKFIESLEKFIGQDEENFDLGKLGKYFEKDSLPVTKGHKLNADIIKLWKSIRNNLIQIANKEAMSLFNCYIDIFELVYDEFRNFSRKDDVLFLGELNQQAKALFNTVNLSVPELYYRLASRLKHYLIDEFQDTSKLQWDNLFFMIEEALSKQGSLFYVGDKKQAIYRFRGGEVNLFDNLRDKFSEFKPVTVNLNKNWRSQKEIVFFNNHIFSAVNLSRFIETQQPKEENSPKYFSPEDINEIIKVFKDSEQEYIHDKDKGYVYSELIECKDADVRDDLIKQKLIVRISDLKNRFPLKDIAVLCRSNKEIELVTGWLIEERIDVESERTLNIKNNHLVKELISFLHFLNSPIDNLNFAAFIMGEIFSKASNIKTQEIRGFLFELRDEGKSNKSFYLYREFQKQYPQAWNEYISEFHKNVGLIPLYELVVSIIEKLGVFRNFPDHQGFLMRFLELIKEEEEDHAGVLDFLNFLDEIQETRLYVNFSNENAIKLLTIHKAKGLGFRVVILPFLEMDVMNMGSRARKIRTSYVVYEPANSDSKLGLLRLDSKYIRFSNHLKNIYHKEYLRSFIDELNTLYVSFTRARDELYLFIPHGMPRTNNIAKTLIPDEFMERGEKFKPQNIDTENISGLMPIPTSNYKQWIEFLKEEFVDKEQIKNKTLIEQGNFMHAILTHIHNLQGRDVKEILTSAVESARQQWPYFKDYEKSKKLVEKLLKSKTVKQFFYIDEHTDNIYQEKELVNEFGHTKRIDRLIVKKDRVIIIDFKSASDLREEFKEQITEYMDLISQIYPSKKVEGYCILLESQKVEKVDA